MPYLTNKLIRSESYRGKRNALIVTLRYGTNRPTKTNMIFNNYTDIAKLLRISPTTVRNICIRMIKYGDAEELGNDESKLLLNEHINFLTSEVTLKL